MYNKLLLTTISLLLSISLFSQEKDKHILFKQDTFNILYNFNKPDKTWELPKKLVEISGLGYIDDHRLACVQDEKGNIYIFNTKKGEVERKIDFGIDGDYEGIEIVGNDAWMLKSSGKIFKVENFLEKDEAKAIKYESSLSGKNNSEGLAHDPITNKLLIACKGHPFIDKKDGKEFKSVFSYNIEDKSTDTDHFLLIEIDTIKYYKHYNTMTRLGVELLAYIDDSNGDLSFQPSGIAIHPITGNIYIIAAVGNLLLIFSREGNILAMVDLKSKVHPQPEGICFSPDGTLYIASEGGDNEGSILKFKMKETEE